MAVGLLWPLWPHLGLSRRALDLWQAELKHGRICMLAWIGYLAVDGGVYAPGAPHVSSFEAHDVTVKTGHMLFLLFVLAIPESLSYTAISEMMSGASDRKPGDYGIGWRFCKVRALGRSAICVGAGRAEISQAHVPSPFPLCLLCAAGRPQDPGEVQARRDHALPRGDAGLRGHGDAERQARHGGPSLGLPVRWRHQHGDVVSRVPLAHGCCARQRSGVEARATCTGMSTGPQVLPIALRVYQLSRRVRACAAILCAHFSASTGTGALACREIVRAARVTECVGGSACRL